ncbi:MAG: prephenate dehydrogenase/arogenate dehydrogenase family protein [Oscillospiraceae bacterium]|nr:prephenate dehydrogenase/arogenate dehydrogenase family protein [Oscillospiraceae bacterium]
MKIAIIGLGLIGGSLARRLRGFHNCEIAAYNRTKESLELALKDGAIDIACDTPGEAMENADLIIMCLYPQLNIDFVRDNLDKIKQGAVITDVTGVKGFITREMEKILPEGIEFIGGHPMAGREVGGYKSSTDTLFDNAPYVITPTAKNKTETIELIRDMAKYVGCRVVTTTSPDEHDAIIAYTSQLMHIVAVALCDNPLLERASAFAGGSLQDCTRIAVINEKMWSELFVDNSIQLAEQITEFQECLERIKQATLSGDRETLEEIMIRATQQKLRWLMK